MKPSRGHFTQRFAPEPDNPAEETHVDPEVVGFWNGRSNGMQSGHLREKTGALGRDLLGYLRTKGLAGFRSFIPMSHVRAAVPDERGNTRSNRTSFFSGYEISAKVWFE